MNLKVRRFAKKPNELMLFDKDTKSFIVAENTTKPVGMEISAIYVPDKHRNKGIGGKLLEAMLVHIYAANRSEVVYLLCWPVVDCPLSLEQLTSFYEKHKFRIVKNGDDCCLMLHDPYSLFDKLMARFPKSGLK